jgi:hypothetical protein
MIVLGSADNFKRIGRGNKCDKTEVVGTLGKNMMYPLETVSRINNQ